MQLQEFLSAQGQGGVRRVTTTFDFAPADKELVLVFDPEPPFGAVLMTREDYDSDPSLRGTEGLAAVVTPETNIFMPLAEVGEVHRYGSEVGNVSQIFFVDEGVQNTHAE